MISDLLSLSKHMFQSHKIKDQSSIINSVLLSSLHRPNIGQNDISVKDDVIFSSLLFFVVFPSDCSKVYILQFLCYQSNQIHCNT